MTSLRSAAALMVSLALAAPAAALDVVETEDFGDRSSFADPIALDFGVNTVSGVLRAADGLPDPNLGGSTLYDDDWLEFLLPPGGELVSVRLIAASLPTAVGAADFSFGGRICNDSANLCLFARIDAATPLPVEYPLFEPAAQQDLGAFFSLVTSPLYTPGFDVFCPGEVGCGWTVEATVGEAAVPLPASAALLALGLAGLWRLRSPGRPAA